MSETAVMTLRMPKIVKREVERLALRFGQKPAQLGVRLIEEGLRKRDYPHVDLRETASGRVAYLAGTRFAVYWMAGMVPEKMTLEDFATEYEVPPERVRVALAYAEAFADEMDSDKTHAKVNRKWIETRAKASLKEVSPSISEALDGGRPAALGGGLRG